MILGLSISDLKDRGTRKWDPQFGSRCRSHIYIYITCIYIYIHIHIYLFFQPRSAHGNHMLCLCYNSNLSSVVCVMFFLIFLCLFQQLHGRAGPGKLLAKVQISFQMSADGGDCDDHGLLPSSTMRSALAQIRRWELFNVPLCMKTLLQPLKALTRPSFVILLGTEDDASLRRSVCTNFHCRSRSAVSSSFLLGGAIFASFVPFCFSLVCI